MEEVFEDKVLDDLFMIRSDGFESSFVKQYGEPEEIKNARQSEEVLINTVKELIQNNEIQEKIIKKIDDFKENMLGEECFWMKPYYKLGFSDGMSFKKEIVEVKKSFDSNTIEDSIFYKYFYIIVETIVPEIRKNKSEYRKLIDKMEEIKNKYPNIRIFIEDRKVIELTNEELNAVLECMKLNDQIEKIEKIESFKLGLKEGN